MSRAAPLPWAMIPTNYWALPVVQIAGHDAAVIVLTLLIDAGQWGAEMSLPPECLDPRRLASATGLAERDGRGAAAELVKSALGEAFDAGLLVNDNGRVWFGPGLWIPRDDVRKKLAADEKKRRRARSNEDDVAPCPHLVRTPSGQGEDTVQQREEKRREEKSYPPSGGVARASAPPPARDDSTNGGSPTLSGAVAPPPDLAGGQRQESKGPIPGDVINRWAALMDAGGAPLRPALVEHLSQAWRDFDGDVIRLALAELEDGKIERHGRCPKPMWLVERCQRIAAEREAGADAAPWRRTDSTAPRTYPGGEGKHTRPREGELPPFTMDDVPDFGIRAIDAIDSVMARPLTDAERFEVASVLRRENRFTIFAVPRFVSGNWRSLHAALAAILPEARRVAEQEAEEAENWDEWYKDGKTPQQRETAERIANMPKPEDVAHKWAAMLACTLPPPPEYVTRNMPKDGEP